MKIYTIGFTGKTARDFFEKLRQVEARYLLDIRLRNNSQLAGFTKKGNIEFFTEQLTKLAYLEVPILAPSEEMLKQYREDSDWSLFEARYLQLLKDRAVLRELDQELLRDGAVLLCSESTPEGCHRRLAAEFLRDELSTEACIIHI